MLRNLLKEQRLLIYSGIAYGLLFVILAVVSMFDQTEILGVNGWIKPMKFASSIGVFLTTLAVYLYFIDGRERSKRLIAIGAVATMIGEMVLIIVQATRGVRSHFNISTPLDGMVFGTMGVLITINTILVGFLLYLYCRENVRLSRSMIWGMRFGLAIMIAASIQGGYMSAQLGHAVGVKDGGPGLPFVNWSTIGGDLRIAHFVGLHALQAIPLFAFLAERFAGSKATLTTTAFAVFYFVLFSAVLWQAILGRPIF